MLSVYSVIGFALIVLALFMQWQVYVEQIVFTFAVSSLVIAAGFAIEGWKSSHSVLLILAALTASVRGVVIPLVIVRSLHDNPWRARENRPVVPVASSILITLALVIGALWLFGWAIDSTFGNAGAYAALPFAVLFQGAFLIVSRRNAFLQMTGYLVIENAVLLLGAWAFPELPLLVEGAVVLDLLGVVIVSRVIMRMREEAADVPELRSAATEDLRG